MDLHKLPAAVTRGYFWFAALMMAAAVSVHLASYGPNQIGPSIMNIALLLFPVVFLVFFPAIGLIALARVPLDRFMAGLPLWVYALGGAVLVYVFLDFFAMVHLLPGQPEQDGANFYFNNHGSLIPVSADAYRTGMMRSARLASGHELTFFGVAALIGYQADSVRRGRIRLDAVPRDDALERSPLPYPLSRLVTLRASLSPEICAERLLMPLPRSAWSWFSTPRGLRGEASATEFRVEIGGPQSQMVYAVGRFEKDGSATSIRLLLTFKRWALISLAASVVLLPVVWAAVSSLGFQLPWPAVVFVVVAGTAGSFLFGLDQRRRLLKEIKQATGAQELASA